MTATDELNIKNEIVSAIAEEVELYLYEEMALKQTVDAIRTDLESQGKLLMLKNLIDQISDEETFAAVERELHDMGVIKMFVSEVLKALSKI